MILLAGLRCQNWRPAYSEFLGVTVPPCSGPLQWKGTALRQSCTPSRPTAVKQTGYEWVYLLGVVNPSTGESSALLAPTVNTAYMNHYPHPRFASESIAANGLAVLVFDRAGWHRAEDLQVPDDITLLHLPAYSPELNLVERLWAYLRSHYLSNRACEHYDDLFNSRGAACNQLTPEQLSSICRTQWIPPTDLS